MIGANAIMDMVLIGLLLAALWFGVRLDKRLKALREAHDGFAKAVHELDNAAIRAHNSLKELRGHADESQDLLHGRILAARDVIQKLEAQASRAERAQLALDRGLLAFEATQSFKSQPSIRAPEAQPVRQVATQAQARQPFDRDQITSPADREEGLVQEVRRSASRSANNAALETAPARRPGEGLLAARRTEELNESETLDKVQMSELVVANLNEMIRTLTLPSRQVPQSLEEDLFGLEDSQRPQPPTRKR